LDLGEGHLLLPRAAGRHRLTLWQPTGARRPDLLRVQRSDGPPRRDLHRRQEDDPRLDVGDVVRVAPYRWPSDDLWGTSRPAVSLGRQRPCDRPATTRGGHGRVGGPGRASRL